MIAQTSSRLEMRLESLDDELIAPDAGADNPDTSHNGSLQQERDSTQKCLEVCEHVLLHVKDAQNNIFEDISTSADVNQRPVTTLLGLISAGQATNDALKACESTLSRTSGWLNSQLRDAEAGLQEVTLQSEGTSSAPASKEDNLDIESTKSALAVVAKASETANGHRVNVYEDVATAEDSSTLR